MKRTAIYLSTILCTTGSAYSFSQNPVADSLLNVIQVTKEDTVKIKAYNTLFLEYEFSDPAKAQECLDKAFQLAKQTDFKSGLAITYLYAGYLAEDKANFPEALKQYGLCLKTNQTIGNKKGEADAHNGIGNIYGNQGNYPEALKNYFASLRIREKNITPGDEDRHKKGIAAAYGNVGTIYYLQDNFPEALKHQKMSLKINEEIGNVLGQANCYNNIGIICAAQGNYQEALENYYTCLKLMQQIGHEAGVADSYSTIGNIFSKQADHAKTPEERRMKLEEALKSHFAALKIKTEMKDQSGVTVNYMNIGVAYAKQKKFADAQHYLDKAKALAKELGHMAYVRNVYADYVYLDSARGNFKGAYENHKMYVAYRDSIDNEQTRKKTIQNQMTYDFEKKEAIAEAEHQKELENQEQLAGEKSRKQKIVIFLVSGFLLLVLFFAGFIFRSLRTTRRQKSIIEEQKQVVEWQKMEVEQQKTIVEEHQKEIIDSITYARRIQRSLLPTEKYIHRNFSRLNRIK